MYPSISIVVPTLNEQDNIVKLINRVKMTMLAVKYSSYSIIVVDDGKDKTKQLALDNGAKVIYGKGLGLGQAIIDGINNSHADIIVVMDSDLSHPPESLPRIINAISCNGYDMVVGSRYTFGGEITGWEWYRKVISRVACLLALPITRIKDSTSGYFAFRKSIIKNVDLKGKSWKIMLEILVKANPDKICELPINFIVRKQGKSKLNEKQYVAYARHLISLTLLKYNKFMKFCIVGGFGAIITFGLTWMLTEKFHLWYMLSMVFAVGVATISNFIMNSIWTFGVGKDMNDADYEWNSYYKGNFVQKYWKRQIAERVRYFINDVNSKIVDVGCGSSPLATELGLKNYVGIDANSAKIEFMQGKKLPHRYVHCKSNRVAIGEVAGYNNDIAMAVEVIEHMPNMTAANELVKTLTNSVRSNGRVIIATPNYGDFRWRAVEKMYGWLMPSAYADDHKTKFNEASLIQMCTNNGLQHEATEFVAGCDMVCRFKKVTVQGIQAV